MGFWGQIRGQNPKKKRRVNDGRIRGKYSKKKGLKGKYQNRLSTIYGQICGQIN